MLESLRIFQLVVHHRSFTAAARSVGLTRPAVSRHIKLLEAHYGVSLLIRSTRYVDLTPMGAKLLKHADRVISAADQMEAEMSAWRDVTAAVLVVGASTLPGEYLFPEILARFRRQLEHRVRVQLRVGNTAEVLRWLEQRHIDLGLIGRSTTCDWLEQVPLAADELVLATPPGMNLPNPLPIEQLGRLPLIIRESGSATNETVFAALQQRGLVHSDFNVVAEMSSPESIKLAVKSGVGCAFLSVRMLEQDAAQVPPLPFVRLADTRIERQLYACWRKGEILADLFQRLLHQAIGNKS